MNEFEGPVVGFRLWYAVEMPWKHPVVRDGRSRSIGSDWLWTGETVEAHCNNRLPHVAPTLGCDCGLYAYDRLETARLYEEEFDSRFDGVLVLGAVLLWGRVNYDEVVERHSDLLAGSDLGLRLRAQFGRVLDLRDDGAVTESAARVHEIPAVREDYLESFAREHGAQVRVCAPARDPGGPDRERRGRLEEGLVRSYLAGGFGA
jgi:hypothetical protein